METVVELLVWNDLVWATSTKQRKRRRRWKWRWRKAFAAASAVVPVLDPERRILTTRVQYWSDTGPQRELDRASGGPIEEEGSRSELKEKKH